MAATGKVRPSPTLRYPRLRRCFDGVIIASFMILAAGGIIAGVRPWVIMTRATLLFFIGLLISRILIRAWASWEELQPGPARRTKKKS